jgi:hypothetical protein
MLVMLLGEDVLVLLADSPVFVGDVAIALFLLLCDVRKK